MADDTPVAGDVEELERITEEFANALQAYPDPTLAFQCLISVVLFSLEGNSIEQKRKFLNFLIEETGVGAATRQAGSLQGAWIKPETPTQHDQLVYLGGWNPAERLPN